MFNNIKGFIKINMNSSSAFKSIVAISTAYVGGKIVDHFTACKQEDTKIKIKELEYLNVKNN